MKINIFLPYKEKFDKDLASSVSITVKNNLRYSIFKKDIKIFGTEVKNPMFPNNFFPITPSWNFLKSRNMHIAKVMFKNIIEEKDIDQTIEIHNRPHIFNYLASQLGSYYLTLFFHNDPISMKGSQTIEERKVIVKKASAIYCVSQFIKDKFLTGLNEGFDKVHILHNGVNRLTSKFPKKDKEILFVGRLVPEKGVNLFVEAASKLAIEYKDWKFFICGTPFLGNVSRHTKFASEVTKIFNQIGKQAIFTGFLSNKEVQQRMKKASIVVVPSLWDEPFGLVVAEAMSNGSAIITTNKGGIPEIIKTSGLIIENITVEKLIIKMRYLMGNEVQLLKYQKLSWNNFIHTSELSSKKLDDIRINMIKKTKY